MTVWWITLASSYLLCLIAGINTKVDMRYNKTWKENLKTCIHYVSSSLIAHNKHFIKESPKKGMTILAIPAGILLTGYIKRNVRKQK